LEFIILGPVELHDLDWIGPLYQRPIDWQIHPSEWLRACCAMVGCTPSRDQYETRALIGMRVVEINQEFALLVDEVAALCPSKPRSRIVSEIVGCLLEDGSLQAHRWMLEPYRQELVDAVVVRGYRGDENQPVRRVLHVQYHNLTDARQAMRLFNAYQTRRYDRRTHLGILPGSSDYVILRCRREERDCEQLRDIPYFDPSIHFPDAETERVETEILAEFEELIVDSESVDIELREPRIDASDTPNVDQFQANRTPSTVDTGNERGHCIVLD
jgi:hypothetical protein